MLPERQRPLAGFLSLLAILLLFGLASVATGAENFRDAPDSKAAPKTVDTPAASAPADAPHKNSEADRAQDCHAPLERLFSTTFHSCMDEAAGVTTAMQDCTNTELERLEKHAAAQHARIAPTLSPERAAALDDALKAWNDLRKHGSAAMYDPDGGSLSPLLASLWHLEQTGRMARWLDLLQENTEP